MNSRNRREIDTGMLRSNMREIRKHIPDNVKVMAVVKADGYGHGAVTVSKAAIDGGASFLAVATASEGLELREAGIQVPILVLGALTESEAEIGICSGLTLTICSVDELRLCEEKAKEYNRTAEIHLKVDTGMGRIGIRTIDERNRILQMLDEASHITLKGIFTHFSDADGGPAGQDYTILQFNRFLQMTEGLPTGIIRHCANSAAIHLFPETYLDMVRAGISLYGYPPVACSWNLNPCMRWTAQVSFIKEIAAGEYISYGRAYRTEQMARIATITCGYGDGYHRIAADCAQILIRGRRFPIVGRICMDQMMADITGSDDIETGDEVVLIGRSGEEVITAEDLASWSRTISYEVLLSAGSRIERSVI